MREGRRERKRDEGREEGIEGGGTTTKQNQDFFSCVLEGKGHCFKIVLFFPPTMPCVWQWH